MTSVVRHLTLPTDLETAWELLTRPEDLEGWLGAEVVLDPTPGTAGLVIDHDGTRRHLVVDEVDEGRRLTWRWWTTEGSEASRVEITVAPSNDGTHVTVVEEAVATRGAQASAAAWSHRLLHLESLLLVAAAVRG
jgi:uncharacterized protein YndB with AHSA1/START domain